MAVFSIPTLVTFPRDDTAFGSFVRATIEKLPPAARADPGALQAALRRWHTRAIVRAQSPLASFGGVAWYVYRDGQAGVRTDETWWQEPGVATAYLGEDDRFIGGDDAACALVDRAPGGLAGVPWRELVPSVAREDDATWLFGDLKQTPVHSVFDFPRADGSRRVIEYRTGWDPGQGWFVCRWRELAVIDAASVPTLTDA
jgi:PAS domain-containing protein